MCCFSLLQYERENVPALNHLAMKAHDGVAVRFHSLTQTLGRGEWSRSHSGLFTHRKELSRMPYRRGQRGDIEEEPTPSWDANPGRPARSYPCCRATCLSVFSANLIFIIL
jgi:hypothetical protein